MRKRYQIALAVLLIVVAGIIAWQGLRQREPVYRGKRLGVWLTEAYQPGSPNPEIQVAIQQIGTNAIPRLLALVRATDTAFKRAVIQFIGRQRLLSIQTRAEWEYHCMAEAGFYALGPKANPAVPALVELLKHNNIGVRASAAHCLGFIGPSAQEAVPALTGCLIEAVNSDSGSQEDQNLMENAATALGNIGPSAKQAVTTLILATNAQSWVVRNAAKIALVRINGDSILPLIEALRDTSNPIKWFEQAMLVRELGTNAEPAIPLLIAALTASSLTVVDFAASALGRIRRQPDACVPALIPLLSSPTSSTRRMSVTALGEFGGAATSAVPAMTRCLTDSDPSVRTLATNILKTIHPAVAARAGVK